MPELPAYVETHKADAALMTFLLVKIGYTVPQCLTTADRPITYDGDTYAPAAGLSVTGIQVSEDRKAIGATITVGNGDDYWGTLLASLTSSQRHPVVQIFEAWFDPAAPYGAPQAVRGLLLGAVESTSWTTTEATLTVGPSTDLQSATCPWRECRSRCSYRRFKGAQCGYTGAATSCDRSFTTCTALGNQSRFGGFRYLPPYANDAAPQMYFVPPGGGALQTVVLVFDWEGEL